MNLFISIVSSTTFIARLVMSQARSSSVSNRRRRRVSRTNATARVIVVTLRVISAMMVTVVMVDCSNMGSPLFHGFRYGYFRRLVGRIGIQDCMRIV